MDNRRCFRNGHTGGEFSCVAALGGDGGPADCLDRHGVKNRRRKRLCDPRKDHYRRKPDVRSSR